MNEPPSDCVGEDRLYPFIVCCSDNPFITRRNYDSLIIHAAELMRTSSMLTPEELTEDSSYLRGICELIGKIFQEDFNWIEEQILELVRGDEQ